MYLVIKLAIARPFAPISGINPYPNTKSMFNNKLTNMQITVNMLGNNTISNACKNSFDMQCKYAPKTENTVIKKYSLIIGTRCNSNPNKSITGINE